LKLELAQTEYWDKVADKKEFSHEIDWDFLGPFLKLESKILDYGCGYGRLTKKIADKGFANVIGVDNSRGMIKRAKRELPNLSFQHYNEETLEFPDNQFDLVFLFAVLTCIPMDKDQNKLIQELRRVIKPNGLFYVSDLLINSDKRNIDRYKSTKYEPYGVFELPEGVILRHHKLDYLKNVVFEDFEIPYEKVYDVRTMNGNKSKAVQLVGQKRNANII
jgi:ubiquinone/menaquinone biosynthesis C-methylase UbiE